MNIQLLKEYFNKSANFFVRAKEGSKLEILYKEILNKTTFLDESFDSPPFKLRMWHCIHGMFSIPECKCCGKPTTYKKDKIVEPPYNEFCSNNCRNNHRRNRLDTLLTKDFLIKEHHNNKKSIERIAKETGCSPTPIIKRLKEFGIKQINHIKLNNDIYKKLNDRELLSQLYINENKTMKEIGEIFGISESQIQIWINMHGIEIKPANSYDRKFVKRSKAEKEIFNFIKNIDDSVVSGNRKILNGLEIDLYIPNKKVAIEYNGILWHSKVFGGKDKNYHLNKTLECEKKGIELIHIFDCEYLNNKEKWQSFIANKIGHYQKVIYARKTIVKRIDKYIANDFIDIHHLQGKSGVDNICYGLFYNNELVSAMSFSHSRYNKKYDWELCRYANKMGFRIVGGASKLLFSFKKDYKGSIISYADRRYSQGKVYKALGFSLERINPPNYYYIPPSKDCLINRQQFIKSKLKNKLKEFDPSASELNNMFNNGYDIIYNCGTMTYVLE